jgi:hypothetical protein
MSSIVEKAKEKGITVKDHLGLMRVMFGDNLLFDTNMVSTAERFLSGCELVEKENVLGLRINGFMTFWIEK